MVLNSLPTKFLPRCKLISHINTSSLLQVLLTLMLRKWVLTWKWMSSNNQELHLLKWPQRLRFKKPVLTLTQMTLMSLLLDPLLPRLLQFSSHFSNLLLSQVLLPLFNNKSTPLLTLLLTKTLLSTEMKLTSHTFLVLLLTTLKLAQELPLPQTTSSK